MLRKVGPIFLNNCINAVNISNPCRIICLRHVRSFKSAYSLDKLYPKSNHDHDFTVSDNSRSQSSEASSEETFDGHIPVDKLTVKYVKSSGPGGQHVNKVNTKADVRFHVATASWLPQHIRDKILDKKKTRINKAGELVFASDRTRSQITNFGDCLQKIRDSVVEVTRKPKEPTEEDQAVFILRVEKANRERLRQKKGRSSIKRDRGRVDFD